MKRKTKIFLVFIYIFMLIFSGFGFVSFKNEYDIDSIACAKQQKMLDDYLLRETILMTKRKLEPGIYSSIQKDDYFNDPCEKPSLNSSVGKLLIDKTPYHAYLEHPQLNPYYIQKDDRKFDIGTAAHAFILEGKNITVLEFDSYRTKESKEQRDFAIENGEFPLLVKEAEKVFAMKTEFNNYILNSEIADEWKGKPEQTIIWYENDIYPMRARIDFLPDNKKLIPDYKTTTNANPIDFINKKILQMSFDFQAAFYLRGLESITGQFAHFVWIIQEIDPPYSCSLVGFGEEFRELGQRKVVSAIDIWIDCLKNNQFNSYPNRIVWAEPKPWASYDFEDKDLISNGGE